jgi:uncharacterized membrane protein YcaP (DUF421 family)
MDETIFWWDGWEPVLRILVVTVLGFVWLLVLVRGTGQRTLSKMSAFDFIIAVTLGSAFGRVVTASEVGLVEVVVAFATLVGLQWAFATARARSRRFKELVDADPELLYLRGQVVDGAMRRHRLTHDDLLGAVRQNGMGALEEAEAIVFEPGGKFAVLGAAEFGDGSAVPGRR